MIAQLLRIPDGQGPRAARLLALITGLSLSLVFLKAAQSGIFLGTFDAADIPRAFLISALTLASLSSIQVAIMPRLGPLWMAAGTLVLGGLGLVGFFGALSLDLERTIVMTLYVFVETLSGLLIIQVWTVTSGALDPRAAKRILPLCGMGSSLAWTAGGALVGPLGGWLGAPALLVIAAAFLGLCAGVVVVIGRVDYAGRQVRRKRVGQKGGLLGLAQGWLSGLFFVRRTGLMRIIAMLSVLALLTEQLMDFAMMSSAQAQPHLADSEALAAFFGQFYAVTSACSMVLLTLVSSRILQRLGASRALLGMPIAVVVLGGAAAALGSFVSVVLLRGVARVLKQSLWGTCLEQTQTPLPVLQRSQAKALVRGVLAPLGYAALAAGLTQLPPGTDPRILAGAAAACALAMAAIVVLWMRRAYVGALHQAVDMRRLDLDHGQMRAAELIDADTLMGLAEEIRTADAGGASLAAEVLGASGSDAALPLLEEAAAHSSPLVRRAAVVGLAGYARTEAADALARLLLEEKNDAVRAEVARGLRRLPWSSEAEAAVRAASVDRDVEVRATCRVARFERSGGGAEQLARILDDVECQDVALTAVTPELAQDAGIEERLRELLGSDDVHTRTAALRCVRRLKLMKLLPDAVALLEDPRCATVAATQIASWGPEALDILANISKFSGGESDGSFYKMARARWAEKAYPVLVRLLAHRDVEVRRGAGRVLCGLVGVGTADPLLRLEVDRIFHCYSILAGLAWDDGVPDWKVDGNFVRLGREIELHIVQARGRLLQMLYLLDEERLIRAVEVGLRRPTPRLAAQVAELLELSLEPHLARRIVPLFDSLSLKERVEAARTVRALDERALQDPLDSIVALGDPHLRRVAMLVYGEQYQNRFPTEFDEDRPLFVLYDRMSFLRGVPLFAGLAGEDLRSVAEIVEPIDLEAGSRIFDEGDPGDNLFLVLSGEVSVQKQGRQVAVVGEKEVLGELAVLDREPRSADAVARTDCRLLRLRGADLEELIARRPQIQGAFVQVLVKRLRATLAVSDQSEKSQTTPT